MARKSTAERAAANPVVHALTPGGYVEFAPFEQTVPGTARGLPPVAANPTDGSLHLLRSPRGDEHPFTWLAAQGAWAPYPFGVGNRLAFSPEFLGSYGWIYVGLAPAVASLHVPKAAPRRRPSRAA